ncbi:MAG: glycosyltransferase [Thermoplasmata archaeon]|nr:glycosyltransferase [Thermoplasmata archaeon]
MSESPGARRPTLLILCEPLVSDHSVQFRFISSVATPLLEQFDITLATTYSSPDAKARLEKIGFAVVAPPRDRYLFNRALRHLGYGSEATYWAEAWAREAIVPFNRRLFDRMLRGKAFDFSVNTTNTAARPSDVWWIQGPPGHEALRTMRAESGGLPLVNREPFLSLVRLLDGNLTRRLYERSRSRAAASNYIREFYEQRGIAVGRTIYNVADLSAFVPRPTPRKARYVLAYIGKETEIAPLLELARNHIRVVAFGSKLIPGMDVARLREAFDFRGRVSEDELVALYSNAEFTAFPFSNEPFGYVPLESMACGTPVLTYSREGPAETVVHGQTGWLVATAQEFVQVASQLWREGFDRERFSRDSIRQSSRFRPEPQSRLLADLLLHAPPPFAGPPSVWRRLGRSGEISAARSGASAGSPARPIGAVAQGPPDDPRTLIPRGR